ncbi:MAG: glutamine amidotransferase [Phycisphaerales bacterium]|nr:glutamine amidotransferase [Phycisphaerales bacterium]
MDALFSLDRFDQPVYLWLVLVIVIMWWLSRRSLAGLGPVRSKLCMGTRSIVVILLVLAIAGTHKILKNDDLNVLFLLDMSKSVPAEVRRLAEQFVLDTTRDMRKDDRAAILTFDGQTNIEQLPSRPGADGGIYVAPPFGDGQRPDQTNVAQGLRMAAACALDNTNNRVVILSDGNQNVGDVLEEAKTASANRLTIDVVPLRYQHGAEIVFEQLRAPPYANLHEQISLRMIIGSDRPTSGRILIHQRVGEKEELIDLDPDDPTESGQLVQLEAGKNPFKFTLPINAQRAHEFRAEFVPDNLNVDVIAENNMARTFTNVEGPQTVLFIGSERGRDDDQMLIDALDQEDIRVHWASAESVDLRTTILQDFAAVILANVGADNFSSDQQRALATYVRDLGGGLVMVGGDDSFGAGGWQGSVVEDVMPVRFDVDAVRQIPRGALAIVMHSCEMPQGNKWGIETAVAALKTLSRLDYFGVIGAGGTGHHWEVPMQPATNKDAIKRQLKNMQNADMFDFQTPMSMAYKALMNCKDAAQRHMIIISDGDPAKPNMGLLNKMVGNKVTCSTVGIFPHSGMEIGTLKWIAKVTGGKYYFLNKAGDEKMLPKIFIKEAKIVRRPLIRDEIFKPKINSRFSDLMRGIDDDLPELKGYVVTTPRREADVELPLLTKRGDPLMAHWLCGFGRTVAFTSGWWRHWGTEWPAWPGFNKFWAQTVRWCMQQGSAANYDVTTTLEGDEGHVIIESMDESEGFANFRQFQGRVVKPDGETAILPIVQTGPGRYEAKFKTNQRGTNLIHVTAKPESAKEKPVVIRTGVTVAYSPEYKDLSTNEALLAEVALETGGRVLTTETQSDVVFAHNLSPVTSRTPIWDTLLKLAVIAFLLDVAFRRIAIDPIKVMATTRTYIASLAGRFGAGRRAEKTLTDLRGIRERVRSEQTKEGDAAVLKPSAPPPISGSLETPGPGPDASSKFDAGDSAKKPAKDLAAAMGGHQDGSGEPAKRKPSTKKDDEPQESTTARLLKAKRRAKDQEGKE